MGLVTSARAKGDTMSPAVREETAEQPVKLEVVEVEPGVTLKLSPADKKAYFERKAAAEVDRQAYLATLAGTPAGAAAAEHGRPEDAGIPPLTVLTKTELESLAEARGLAKSGSKAQIAKRFGADDSVDDEGEGDDADGDGDADGSSEGDEGSDSDAEA
jgi:hypothetical protein